MGGPRWAGTFARCPVLPMSAGIQLRVTEPCNHHAPHPHRRPEGLPGGSHGVLVRVRDHPHHGRPALLHAGRGQPGVSGTWGLLCVTNMDHVQPCHAMSFHLMGAVHMHVVDIWISSWWPWVTPQSDQRAAPHNALPPCACSCPGFHHTLGSGSDSTYEYMIKQWILSSGQDEVRESGCMGCVGVWGREVQPCSGG